MITGRATEEGTARAAARSRISTFVTRDGLSLTALGLGTSTFAAEVISHAIATGVTLIETASSYRGAELAIGRALRESSREEVVVISKVGYTRGRSHSLAVPVIRSALASSRRRLGLATLDGYLLHNPELAELPALDDAFSVLEEAVDAGHITAYGVSCWTTTTLTVRGLLAAATRVGGRSHHFRYVEAPVRVGDTAAVPWLARASAAGLYPLVSRPLGRGELAREGVIMGGDPRLTPAQRALTFATRAIGQGTVLFGTTSLTHFIEDVETLQPSGHVDRAKQCRSRR